MKRIILSTVNLDYLDVAKAWLASMRLHGNDYHVRLDFINGDMNIYSRLHKIYPNLLVVHHDIPKVPDIKQNLLNLMYTRPPQMWKALNEDWDQICSMDCDTLMRGSISGLWDGVEPGTIKIRDQGTKVNPVRRYQGAVYIFGNSPEIKAYYKDVIDTIGSEFAFYAGQLALHTMAVKHQASIRFVPLDKKYNDNKFKKDSLIWHSKHGHINEKPFSKYLQTCLVEANKYYDN